jgi:hypothetical protein
MIGGMSETGRTTARGYGAEHQKRRKQAAALVAAGLAVCWRCRRPIWPGMLWDLGHDDLDRSIYRGVEHRYCNRRAGALKKQGRLRSAPKKVVIVDRW